MKSLASLLMVCLSMCVFCTTARATVTITNNDFRAWASLAVRELITTIETGTTIPTAPSPLPVDAVIGDAYSKNVLDWSVNGGQTILSFDSLLQRVGVIPSVASVDLFSFEFTVDVDSAYELSGYLDVTDGAEGQSGIVLQFLQLYDSAAGLVPFSGQQQSFGTHDEQFVLGGLGGDDINQLFPTSSLTGMLLANHTYQLDYHAMIGATNSDAGANAVGNLTLKIGTVPEPSAVALCSLHAVLGLVRRRPGKSC